MTGQDDRPLTVGQEALWLLYELAPDSAAYNVVLAMRVRTELDIPRLERALTRVAALHPVLSETFVEVDGAPRRRPGPADRVRLEVRDEPTADLFEASRSVAATPFRLDREVPLRAVLIRRRADDAALILVTHHLASDATSQWLLARDLLRAYAETDPATGSGGGPEDQPAGFDQVVDAERRLLDSPRRAELERYWRGVAAGVPAAQLPADRPRPPAAGAHVQRGDSTGLWFDDELAAAVSATARRVGVTPFAFLVGALQSLLHRYTGQSDFLIGCPTTTRFHRGLRELVGYLANSVVLRATFDRSVTFGAAARAAHREIARAMAHAAYPYPALTAMLQPATPLFTTAVTMLVADRLEPPLPMVEPGEREGREIEYAGLRLALLDVPQMEGQFDLLVELRQAGGGLSGVLKYNADLYDRATVDRFATAFTRFVRLAAENPDAVVSDVSLVDRDELSALLDMGSGAVGAGTW
jgi:hypothetical protein